jgi:hypothetical protein
LSDEPATHPDDLVPRLPLPHSQTAANSPP